MKDKTRSVEAGRAQRDVSGCLTMAGMGPARGAGEREKAPAFSPLTFPSSSQTSTDSLYLPSAVPKASSQSWRRLPEGKRVPL